jgi:hypothetical protein
VTTDKPIEGDPGVSWFLSPFALQQLRPPFGSRWLVAGGCEDCNTG